jgi:site-specific DNA-cytosine methylase
MSIGLENAGFDVKWVVDSNHLAVTTLAANRRNPGDVNVYAEKLSAFLKNCIKDDPAYPKPGEVDHIHASPPCKGFSRANRNGGKDDSMNNKVRSWYIAETSYIFVC